MKQFLLVLATLGLALAAPRQDPPHSVRIVGGDEISIEDAPYQVVLILDGGQWCGGSLIGPRTVVTAGHCYVRSLMPDLTNLNVRSASSKFNEGGLLVNVSKVVVHPGFDRELNNDIAILFLNSDAIVDGYPSKAIELVDTNTTFPAGTNATVSGWGDLNEGGPAPVVLRSVTVPVVSEESCRESYGEGITDKVICAGLKEGGKDSCQGDSGGPLTVGGKLAGIVSNGRGCAQPGFPGVYTKVASFREWVKETTGI